MISPAYILEIIFLSVALSMDSFTVSITCGLQKTLTRKRTLLLAFSFAFFQALLPSWEPCSAMLSLSSCRKPTIG